MKIVLDSLFMHEYAEIPDGEEYDSFVEDVWEASTGLVDPLEDLYSQELISESVYNILKDSIIAPS